MPQSLYAGVEIEYSRPETAREVLLWRVWIPTLPLQEQLGAVAEYAAGYCDVEPWRTHDAQSSADVIASLALRWAAADDSLPDDAAQMEVYRLAERIARSAELPQSVAGELQAALDIQNDIDPKWVPKDKYCTCPKCRRADIDKNPPGVSCKYDAINPIALAAASVALGVGEGAADEPYYLVQIRHIAKRSEARLMRHGAEARDKHSQWRKAVANVLGEPGGGAS